MTTSCWILVGIFAVSFLSYIIFTFINKVKIVQDISSTLIMPSLGILNIIFLSRYIPDSYHIIKISLVAFGLLSIAQVITTFIDNEKGKIINGILFLASIISWIFLYKSEFLIHKVSSYINLAATITYFILTIFLLNIFTKKQTFNFYLFALLALGLTSFLNYSSIVAICFNPINYNIIKLIATTLLLIYVIFMLLNSTCLNFKFKNMIGLTIIIASYVLIALSNLIILD